MSGNNDDALTQAQVITMRVLYSIGTILFALNFGLASHNIIRYLILDKIGGKLTKLFYLPVVMLNLAQVYLYILLACDPNDDKFKFHINSLKPTIGVLDWIILSCMYAIGCIVVVQMYQLSDSIRQFLTSDIANSNICVIYLLACVIFGLYATLTLIFEYLVTETNRNAPLEYIFIGFYSLLSLGYSLTMVHLRSTLNRMSHISAINEAKR